MLRRGCFSNAWPLGPRLLLNDKAPDRHPVGLAEASVQGNGQVTAGTDAATWCLTSRCLCMSREMPFRKETSRSYPMVQVQSNAMPTARGPWPEAEHVLDWFHVAMRLTVLRQMTKGACPARPSWAEQRLCNLERLKWLLWHGHARQAVAAAQELADDAWGREEDAKEDGTETAEARSKRRQLHATAEELATYLRRNAEQIVNYGERHRAGERISTGFVESAVNQVVSKRFSKRQSMRWTQAGAHLALQARTRVLNGELENVFRRRWPGFQPLKAEQEETKNGSFDLPPVPAPISPVAHVL